MTDSASVDGGLIDSARAELGRLDRRLRSLTVSAWRLRRTAVDLLLAQLLCLASEAEARNLPDLPHLPEYALADAVAVISADVLAADPSRSVVERLVGTVLEALDATR